MDKKWIVKSMCTAVLSLTAALATSWALPPGSPARSTNPASEQTLTGIVRDSLCPGGFQNRPKNATPLSCTLKCVHEGKADYVLVVGNSVYVLQGRTSALDRFAGGPASVTGRVDGNRIAVDSVAAAKNK